MAARSLLELLDPPTTKWQTGRKAGTQSQGPTGNVPGGSRLSKGQVVITRRSAFECALFRSIYLPRELLCAKGAHEMSCLKKLQRFLTSEDGPTAVEYAVMLALIIVVCLVAIQSLGTNTSTTFTNISNSLGS